MVRYSLHIQVDLWCMMTISWFHSICRVWHKHSSFLMTLILCYSRFVRCYMLFHCKNSILFCSHFSDALFEKIIDRAVHTYCNSLIIDELFEKMILPIYNDFLIFIQYTILSHWLSFGPSGACIETPHLRGYINSSFNLLCSEVSKCQTFVQVCMDIFFSFIHNVQGRHFLVLLSFFLQKFKMLTTTMLWPHILQITTRRLCRAISRKKYVMIIMVYSFYFQGPVFCPDPESDSLSHQQYDLVGLSTGATNWCNVGAFTRIAQ